MIILSGANDIIRVNASGATALDVHASYVDLSGTTVTPGRTNTAVAASGNTTVVAAPGANTYRNVKLLVIRNEDATTSNTVTVEHYDGTTAATLAKRTLAAGEQIAINERGDVLLLSASGAPVSSVAYVNPTGLLIPPHFSTANLTSNKTITSGSSFAVYVGRAPRSLSSVVIRCRVTTGTGTPTWAEAAIAKGAINPGGNPTLTVVGYLDISATHNGTGQKTSTIPVSSGQTIDAGDDLWVILGNTAVTALAVRAASIADDIQAGLQASLGSRPSTIVGAATAWTIEGATVLPAWVVAYV